MRRRDVLVNSRVAVDVSDGMPVKGKGCIRIATGNIMTMHPKLCHSGPLAQQGIGQRGAILQRQLVEFDVDAAGLQEGRLQKDLQTRGESYHVRTSAADSSGRYGSQCWVRDSELVSIGASVPVCPRICYTMMRSGGVNFANVSAHAPCRDSKPAVRAEFWTSLSRVLHDVVHKKHADVTILCIDANGRVGSLKCLEHHRRGIPNQQNCLHW